MNASTGAAAVAIGIYIMAVIAYATLAVSQVSRMKVQSDRKAALPSVLLIVAFTLITLYLIGADTVGAVQALKAATADKPMKIPVTSVIRTLVSAALWLSATVFTYHSFTARSRASIREVNP